MRATRSEVVAIVAEVATLGPVFFCIPPPSRSAPDLFLHGSKVRDIRDICDSSLRAEGRMTATAAISRPLRKLLAAGPAIYRDGNTLITGDACPTEFMAELEALCLPQVSEADRATSSRS